MYACSADPAGAVLQDNSAKDERVCDRLAATAAVRQVDAQVIRADHLAVLQLLDAELQEQESLQDADER